MLLFLLFGGATALQCDVPGECYIMTVGGYEDNGNLDDVELTSLDQELFSLPDCLTKINSLPVGFTGPTGSLDYSRKCAL